MSNLLSDIEVIDRVLDHIDHNSTDLGEETWYEPTKNYTCPERFKAEMELFRRIPLPFCPSAAVAKPGDYVARDAAGVPIIAVRGEDGVVRDVGVVDGPLPLVHSLLEFGVADVPQRVP